MPIRRRQHLRSISAAVLRSPGGPLVIENLVMEGLLREEVLVLVAGGIRHTDIDFYDRGASVPVVLATRVQASSKRLARPWRVRSAAIMSCSPTSRAAAAETAGPAARRIAGSSGN